MIVRMKLVPVDNEMASFLASQPSRVGYGTNSLMEQWRETYGNADYDYDPYDDDMFEGQEIPDNIQSICDNLDIKFSVQTQIDVIMAAFALNNCIRSSDEEDVILMTKWHPICISTDEPHNVHGH
ncbi:hypothetical protein Tco_0613521 [Tanacetum coccineum]